MLYVMLLFPYGKSSRNCKCRVLLLVMMIVRRTGRKRQKQNTTYVLLSCSDGRNVLNGFM